MISRQGRRRRAHCKNPAPALHFRRINGERGHFWANGAAARGRFCLNRRQSRAAATRGGRAGGRAGAATSRHALGRRRQKRRPTEADEGPPHAPNDNSAEPQVHAIKSALSNVPLNSAGAVRGGLGRRIKPGQIKPAPLEKHARASAPRIIARRARAIKRRLKENECFVYGKGAIPAEGGGKVGDQAADLRRAEKKREKHSLPKSAKRFRQRLPIPASDKVLASLRMCRCANLPTRLGWPDNSAAPEGPRPNKAVRDRPPLGTLQKRVNNHNVCYPTYKFYPPSHAELCLSSSSLR